MPEQYAVHLFREIQEKGIVPAQRLLLVVDFIENPGREQIRRLLKGKARHDDLRRRHLLDHHRIAKLLVIRPQRIRALVVHEHPEKGIIVHRRRMTPHLYVQLEKVVVLVAFFGVFPARARVLVPAVLRHLHDVHDPDFQTVFIPALFVEHLPQAHPVFVQDVGIGGRLRLLRKEIVRINREISVIDPPGVRADGVIADEQRRRRGVYPIQLRICFQSVEQIYFAKRRFIRHAVLRVVAEQEIRVRIAVPFPQHFAGALSLPAAVQLVMAAP